MAHGTFSGREIVKVMVNSGNYWKPGETRDTALSTDNLQGDAETTLADLDDVAVIGYRDPRPD